MIVKMLKTYVVARRSDQDRLLESLRDLGVVHLTPVDAASAVAGSETLGSIDRLGRAIQVLSSVTPEGTRPELTAVAAADETLEIQRVSAENRNRLNTLHRQLAQLDLWGDVRREDFEELRRAGIDLRFFIVPSKRIDEIKAELVHVISTLGGKKSLLAVADRSDGANWPDDIEPLDFPAQDRPSIRIEAAEIDAQLKTATVRLQELAYCLDDMRAQHARLTEHAQFTIAQRSGLADENLFALQGWVPVEKAQSLSGDLAKAGIEAAVELSAVTEQDNPPTLIHYPAWVKPIKALFDMLGTLPGYREIDLSPFFMIALPLFAAILIGDAGYGLLFLLTGVLLYRPLAAKAGKPAVHLLIIMGVATFIWGALSANYFGITPDTIAQSGGWTFTRSGKTVTDVDAIKSASGTLAGVGKAMMSVGVLWNPDGKAARELMMKIAFIIGSLHLIIAHLRKAVAFMPSQLCLAEIGWIVIIGDMFVLIWYLVFIGVDKLPPVVWMVMAAGWSLPILFGRPSKNIIKRILGGFGTSLLPLLGTFSDTMSYIRLMAVGLASYYIASAFNSLGVSLADSATWFAGAPVILFGHALNIGLALIAIFAHGVRLNMLEFSNNVGVQWAGYQYRPFAKSQVQG